MFLDQKTIFFFATPNGLTVAFLETERFWADELVYAALIADPFLSGVCQFEMLLTALRNVLDTPRLSY